MNDSIMDKMSYRFFSDKNKALEWLFKVKL